MKTTLRTLFLPLLLIALVAAACGADSDDETVTTGDDTAVPTPSDGDGTPTPDGPLGAGPYPIAELTVEYRNDTESYTYGITCLGDTATLSGDAPATVVDQSACATLAEPDVQDRLLGRVDLSDRICTAEFGGTDRAVITGRIDDQPVDFEAALTNGCEISDWNDLLADLLPPPSGA